MYYCYFYYYGTYIKLYEPFRLTKGEKERERGGGEEEKNHFL